MLRLLVLLVLVVDAASATARTPGEPIQLTWIEGDVAGQNPIFAAEGGKRLGIVVYRQHRRGDLLEATRVSYFADGSSDEDTAVARVGRTLEAVRGRSIIRDARGRAIVDLHIDVAGGRITGFYDDGERHVVDVQQKLEPATYWGPLIFIAVKNFDANAEDDRVRFLTVAPTPKPRVLTMELVRSGRTSIDRYGTAVPVEQYTLRPTLGWLVDPIVQRWVPSTQFFVEPGEPPSLARYAGPRNYQRQEIRLE
jgi:hypothetical protein